MIRPPPPPAPRQPFALETLARLPLAEAFYALWAHLATGDVLDELFALHRGRCYHDQLGFAKLVEVLSDALTRYRGSGRRAIVDALQRQQLPTQARAVYGKLARLPPPLAEAFLAALTARLRPLFPAGLSRAALPASLAGLAQCYIGASFGAALRLDFELLRQDRCAQFVEIFLLARAPVVHVSVFLEVVGIFVFCVGRHL